MGVIQCLQIASFSEPNKIPQASSLRDYRWANSLPNMSTKSWERLLNLVALSLTVTLLSFGLDDCSRRFSCPLLPLRNHFPQDRVLTNSPALQRLPVQTWTEPSFYNPSHTDIPNCQHPEQRLRISGESHCRKGKSKLISRHCCSHETQSMPYLRAITLHLHAHPGDSYSDQGFPS